LLLLADRQAPLFLLNQAKRPPAKPDEWLSQGATNSPPLRQAVTVDFDLDGWTDAVGLSANGVPVLLHNDTRRLGWGRDALGADESWPKDLVAVAVFDCDGDHYPDLVTWSESGGLHWRRNHGNGNHGLPLVLRGAAEHRKHRCSADAFGVRISALAGG